MNKNIEDFSTSQITQTVDLKSLGDKMGKKNALVLSSLLLAFSFSFTLQAVTGSQSNKLSAYLQEKTVIASSATWWVPDNFGTIQEAINSPLVSPRDTIRVRPDIYNEHVVINKPVSLIGENSMTTIIDGSGTGTVVNVTASNVYLSGFTVKSGDYGIYVFGSANSTVRGNNVNNNKWEGIWLDHSSHCVISENNASYNEYDGIWLKYSSHCTVNRNIANNNYAYGILVDYFSSNCTITENNATQNWIGISVEKESHNCTITENNSDNNEYHGLQIYLSQNCAITRNNANNNWYYGIHVHFSNNSAISKNTADNNGEGIYLEGSDHCTADKNVVHNNYYGIWFVYSDHCTVVGNTASNNTIGAYLYRSNNTIIYHNNFVNNTKQVEIIESYNNAWDNGYPSGGNHWSNYTGTDHFSGPDQNEPGSDGIGDTPHAINENNADNYPLINPWTNIAIKNVLPCKTIVGEGYSLSITVTVENQGHTNETFDVTASHNMTNIVPKQTIALPSRRFTTITFTWNTTGVAKGNYTISAYANPVLGETDTTDNTYVDGWVRVVIPGDVNGDGCVDIFDAVIIGLSFGSCPDDSNWDPRADIIEDDLIDIFDMVVVALHFGEIEA